MLKKCQKITCFTDEKHEADDFPSLPSPFPFTVYTFKTSPCMPAPRAHVEKTCGFSACHTPHTTTHHTTRRQTKRDRDKERREEKRREEKRREEKRREEKRREEKRREEKRREEKRREEKRREEKRREERNTFSVWWCMAFFVGVVLCLVKPVNARVLSLLDSGQVQFIFDFSAPWPVDSC